MTRPVPVVRPDPVAVGLILGFCADRVLGDPRRWHPVAGFGRLAQVVEQRLYPGEQTGSAPAAVAVRGAVAVGGLVGAAALLGRLDRAAGRARPLVIAALTWAVLGGRSLEREGGAMAALLRAGDLAGARRRVTHLVGRDPSELSAAELSRATVESVAENSADAVVAPLLWGAVAGGPGLTAYRAINTLDAMWGHRTPRYATYGRAAARLDDLANLAPARLTVLLIAALAGRRAGLVLGTVRRDAPAHPSPNAGPVEAAWAGALGLRLGGQNSYSGASEDRGTLGSGPAPTVGDIDRSVAALRALSWAALALTAGARIAIVAGMRRSSHPAGPKPRSRRCHNGTG